jgi:hypothetical protein
VCEQKKKREEEEEEQNQKNQEGEKMKCQPSKTRLTAAACEARSIGVSTKPGVARWIETPVGISWGKEKF